MDEFDLIDAVVAAMGDATSGEYVVLGPGDDAAVTRIPAGMDMVTSVDSLVAGVHFPPAAPGHLVGHRALGVSVSDLAAMGATPTHVVVAVTLSDDDKDWLIDVARGMAAAAKRMNVAIVGGNLSEGPRNISVTAMGIVPAGGALLRSGARIGDSIFVSGEIGGAGLGMIQLPSIGGVDVAALATSSPEHPLVRYFMPQPRVGLGVALRGVASAAIDVSDGLVADLAHLCRASRVGARLMSLSIPIAQDANLDLAMYSGDDYELLFTVPPKHLELLDALRLDVPVERIGEIIAKPKILVREDDLEIEIPTHGYRHFS